MRAREIRELLRGKIDPELGTVLVSLAEDISALKVQMREMGELITKLTKIAIVHTELVDQHQKFQKSVEKMGIRVAAETDGGDES